MPMQRMNREQFFDRLATFDEQAAEAGPLESLLAWFSRDAGTH
jgi:hypothetical protein